MRGLAKRLGIALPHAVGIMEMLWHYAGEITPRGDIGSAEDDEIAEAVAWKKKPSELIEALVIERWLDLDEAHRLVVHDWPDHADNSVKKWLQRNRKDFLPLYGKKDRQCPGHSPGQSTEIQIDSVRPTREDRQGKDRQGKAPEAVEFDFYCTEIAEKLWGIHPFPSDHGGVTLALSKEKYKSADPKTFNEKIASSLSAWAAYWEQTGRHPIALKKWVESGDYAREPPQVSAIGKPKPKSTTAERLADL